MEETNELKLNLIETSRDVNNIKVSQWTEPFFFIQAADTQLGLINRFSGLESSSIPNWDAEVALSEQLVDACNRMEPKPKFMVVCGDLVDARPIETWQQQVDDFKRVFSKLDPNIPLVCVCGNHDIGDNPTMEAINKYKKNFGDDYFYFILKGVLFIVINSQFYENREFVEEYASEQDRWLESILSRCKDFKYSIVFEHIPWFLRDPNEEDDYFNINKDIRLKWLRKFQEAGVDKIMCGHYHRNAGGWFDDMELVITSAIGCQLGDDVSGARIVKVTRDGIKHQYYSLNTIPNSIDLSSSSN